MKKLLTLAVAMLVLVTAQAQQLRAGGTKLLPGTEKGGFYHPVFSPTGDYLLTSTEDYNGLTKHDLTNGAQIRLSDAQGAGYGVRITKDGKQVICNRYEYSNHLRLTSVERIDVSSTQTATLRRAARTQTEPVAEVENIYVTTNGYEMTIHNGATQTVIRPNGDESYFWCSVSPDGKHIVYVTAHHGTQVCNIDGTNPIFMGIMNAPQWLDNDNVVAMRDEYKNETLQQSKLVVRNINNPREVITLQTNERVAMYPAVSTDGKHIAFNNEKGQIFIMEVRK